MLWFDRRGQEVPNTSTPGRGYGCTLTYEELGSGSQRRGIKGLAEPVETP